MDVSPDQVGNGCQVVEIDGGPRWVMTEEASEDRQRGEGTPMLAPGPAERGASSLLGILRHDLQNPLHAAATNLSLARQDVARGEYELLVESADDGASGRMALADTGVEALQGVPGMGNPGYPTFGGSVSENEKALILRRPQLKAAQAALQASKAGKQSAEVAYKNAVEARKRARASLEQAKLDFDRTTIEVPFNAVVQSEQVGVGSYVSPGNPLASLVNTDRYRVEVSVPLDQLRWIRSPSRGAERGSKVRIYHPPAWGEDRYRLGRVRRLKAGIEEQGRMARVVIDVEDPRALKEPNGDKPMLLLDSFVEVEIMGKEIRDAVMLPREALRSGNKVWLVSSDNTLEIRDVTIEARASEHVYVTEGLEAGDMLITSDVPTPVEGMKLKRASSSGGSGGSDV